MKKRWKSYKISLNLQDYLLLDCTTLYYRFPMLFENHLKDAIYKLDGIEEKTGLSVYKLMKVKKRR